MARKSKNVDDFAAALMNKTKLLKQTPDKGEEPVHPSENQLYVELDKKLYGKFKILAMHQQTKPEELIDEALNHYLRLKRNQLEQAVYELTREE